MYTKTKTVSAVIVDDHEMFRKGFKYLLSEIPNIKVIGEVTNGIELLNFLETNNAELIFMDIKMPEMDGVEATKKVMKQYPDKKIIVLTLYGYKQYYIEMIDAGAKAFVLKSAKIKEIQHAIYTVLEGELYISHELENDFHENKKINLLNIKFSKRELEVLQLASKGCSNKEIAEKLFISNKTVEWHKGNLLNKTNSKNSASLVAFAIKNDLIKSEI